MDELLLTLLIQIMIVLILALPFHTHVLPNSKAREEASSVRKSNEADINATQRFFLSSFLPLFRLPSEGRDGTKKTLDSAEQLLAHVATTFFQVQGSVKRWSPGCVIAAGKARQ